MRLVRRYAFFKLQHIIIVVSHKIDYKVTARREKWVKEPMKRRGNDMMERENEGRRDGADRCLWRRGK